MEKERNCARGVTPKAGYGRDRTSMIILVTMGFFRLDVVARPRRGQCRTADGRCRDEIFNQERHLGGSGNGALVELPARPSRPAGRQPAGQACPAGDGGRAAADGGKRATSAPTKSVAASSAPAQGPSAKGGSASGVPGKNAPAEKVPAQGPLASPAAGSPPAKSTLAKGSWPRTPR